MKTKLVLCMYQVGQRVYSLRQLRLFTDKRGFGMNELLGIAAAVIIAAFIIIPRLQEFAGDVMDGLDGWWSGTIKGRIFPPPPTGA